MNILPVVVLSMSLPSLALFDKDTWDVDARYDYIRSTSNWSIFPTTIKSSSLNITLDDDIDESTNIHGVFTLDNSNTTPSFSLPKKDKVRQLSLSHKFDNNTQIKIGKQAFSLNKNKGVQDLGVATRSNMMLQPYYCDENLGYICDGRNSIVVNTPLNKNTELQILASKIKAPSFVPNTEHYIARVKHSAKGIDYYAKLGRNDDLTSFINSSQNSLGLSAEFQDKEDLKDRWYIDYEQLNYNDHISRVLLNEARCSGNITSRSGSWHSEPDNSKSLSVGKITTIDKVLINAEIKYLKLLNNEIYRRTYCDGETPMRSTTITPWWNKSKTATLMFEYPITNGKFVGNHTYYNRYEETRERSIAFSIFRSAGYEFTGVMNEVFALYDLNNNLSARLGYRKIKVSFDGFPGIGDGRINTTSIGLKYKF